MTVVIAALYQFKDLKDYQSFQSPLFELCKTYGIKGTILLAHEGINGTVAGSRPAIDHLKEWLITVGGFYDMEYKESFCTEMPFYRLKVRLKKEIVTLGHPEADPTKIVGQAVTPREWNQLLQDPEITVIDTRNDYEVKIGTFKGSLNPGTKTFREFPAFVTNNLDPKKHRKIAMHCTGNIRCEKASSYMLQQGFEAVYHLKGGILKYLETVNPDDSLWEGECFVFDNRVTVKHGLEVGDYELCHGCRHPLSSKDKSLDGYVPGVSCPNCALQTTAEQKQRFHERQKQIHLAKQRGETHIGG